MRRSRLAKQQFPHLHLRDHRPCGNGCQTPLSGLSGMNRLAPRPGRAGSDCRCAQSSPRRLPSSSGQCLRLRCVASPLLAALCVVKAKSQFGSMPRACDTVEHRRLPGEVIRKHGRAFLVSFQSLPCASRYCADQLPAPHKTACECSSPDAPFSSPRSAQLPLSRPYCERGWRATRLLSGAGDIRLPSSLTEPINIGTFFEISGAHPVERAHRDRHGRPESAPTHARSWIRRRPDAHSPRGRG